MIIHKKNYITNLIVDECQKFNPNSITIIFNFVLHIISLYLFHISTANSTI